MFDLDTFEREWARREARARAANRRAWRRRVLWPVLRFNAGLAIACAAVLAAILLTPGS